MQVQPADAGTDFGSALDWHSTRKLKASTTHAANGIASIVYMGAVQAFDRVASGERTVTMVSPDAATQGQNKMHAETRSVIRAVELFPPAIRQWCAATSTAGKSKT